MTSVVWFNGRICPAEQARIDVADRGLTLGDGLFETLRVHEGRVLRLPLHAARLQNGGAVLQLPVPTFAEMAQATQELLAATGLQSGSMRLTVTRGVGVRGLLPPTHAEPTVVVTATEGAPTVATVSLMTSRLIRQDEQSPLCRMKSLNYLPHILARQEAARAGADEALLLNTQGRVAETTISTVVVQQSGNFMTPPVSEGALPGVARAVLFQAGLIEEQPLAPAALSVAEAVYLINSLGVRCVTSLDGHPLPLNKTGARCLCQALAVPLEK
ncbi:2-keto-4-methylthiobutyrate aminotransferase [Acetobacter cibinongensis]|uniref:Probable branched-chain-amino-acid aminotransferase n=2 Tax=Acetobacter cibinongensis TaxID=146475 RepID=A0A0D6N1S3_9PROT|nr:aminotransferase class IV [Acetobacter cibinongensis]GAN59884.1 aminotransferase [Acetobacter cibinongensis]GEL57504.1 2-keto-4-methylthiobutyrate aminotransferase [Acetobacter cibinongensis]